MLTVDEARLDETFAALANSTRRAILARLVEGEANVNELAEPFQMSLPAISKHLKVLERAGLILRGQRAQYRPCTLNPQRLQEVSTWAEHYRPLWEASFDRMDDYLRQVQKSAPPAATNESPTEEHEQRNTDKGTPTKGTPTKRQPRATRPRTT